MNIFLEAVRLSPVAVLWAEFLIPWNQEAADRVAEHCTWFQICKETRAVLRTITGSETNETETQGTHWKKRKSINDGATFGESVIKLKELQQAKLLGRGFAVDYNRRLESNN